MSTLWQDLQFGWRSLSKRPGFMATAVLCLAVGIGGTTLMFSLVHAILLRPLPFEDADRLVVLRSNSAIRGLRDYPVSDLDLLDYQRQCRSFEAMAAYEWKQMDLIGEDRFDRLQGLLVSKDFFEVLRLRPIQGRTFGPDEFDRGGTAVVLSQHLCERLFDHAPALGEGIRVNSWKNFPEPGTETLTVVGVMPANTRFLPATAGIVRNGIGINQVVDYWGPAGVDREGDRKRDDRRLDVVARLKEGVTLEQAQAELTLVTRRLQEAYPQTNEGWSVSAKRLSDCVVGDVRLPLQMLLGAVGCVLALACANVAHLVLIRGTARQKEIATRTAIGARPLRVFRQLLTESLLLSVLGGILGLTLAWGAKDLVVALAPSDLPRFDSIRLDVPVLGFTFLLALMTAIGVGLLPAIRAMRLDLNTILKAGTTLSTRIPRRRAFGGALVIGQIALTLVLLIGAGLMIKSFRRIMAVDPGFPPERLLSMTVSLPSNQYPWEYNSKFCIDVRNRLASLSGVESATAIRGAPMSGSRIGFDAGDVVVEGKGASPLDRGPKGYIHVVADDYFQTMKIPLQRGRVLKETDAAGPVGHVTNVVINETMARRFWPNQDALGKRFSFRRYDEELWITVVGIVGDAAYEGLDRPTTADVYFPERNFPQSEITMLIRTSDDPRPLIAAVQREVHAINRHAFVLDVKTMKEVLSDSQSHRRFIMFLLTAFSLIALGLAVTGIYGVTAYSLAQRKREFGVRAALGALPTDLVHLVLKQGLIQMLLGIGLGLAIAAAASRLLASLLYAVKPTDITTLAVVIVLVISAGIAARYFPARRASKVDPMRVLRTE